MVGLAVGLDLLFGEPPNRFHPVAWFGRLVGSVERFVTQWCDERLIAHEWTDGGRVSDGRMSVQRVPLMLTDDRSHQVLGVVVAVGLPLVPAAVAWWIVLGATTIHSMLGIVVATLVLTLTISIRALLDLTREVLAASVSDLETARESVVGLVGRDVDGLSGGELRSAAVESVAENFADGVVATLLPFALLAPISLPAAAAAAAWVKGVNTLDSMLGYPSKPIGTASARLDDVVMYLPARISAVLLALAAVDPIALYRARRWVRTPASPNSGWPMATIACSVDVRLEKEGAYVLNPSARLPTVGDGRRAVSIVALASLLAVVLAGVCALVSPTIAATISPLLDVLPEWLTSLPEIAELFVESAVKRAETDVSWLVDGFGGVAGILRRGAVTSWSGVTH